jgi:hypothetical protein
MYIEHALRRGCSVKPPSDSAPPNTNNISQMKVYCIFDLNKMMRDTHISIYVL